MDYTALKLQLRQVEEAFSRSRINVYSDEKKVLHFSQLYDLFEKISEVDLSKLSDGDLEINYNLLGFILNGLEYLDNSTLNVIPYELVSCLEIALKDWVSEETLIIVTSLSNKHLEYLFSINPSAETFERYNEYINSTYNLKITHRLIRITLPKSLSRDYLSSVVLYHELGHFIDFEFQISEKILLKKYITGNWPAPDMLNREYRHTMEYFADLFAAQYVNKSSNLFLERITPTSQDKDSDTHPSTTERIKTVNSFLDGVTFPLLDEFNNVLTSSNLPTLQIRHTEIDVDNSNFKSLCPQIITTEQELHSIFKLAWDIWLNCDTNFLKGFHSRQQYNIINNLVEKSISNYTVKQNWARLKAKLN